jgi:GNAT superfamily N-acetyltransferase
LPNDGVAVQLPPQQLTTLIEHMTHHPITYRHDVLPTDREAVRRLVESTGVFNSVEVDVAVELVDDRLELGQQSDYHFVFAELDGRVVGYTCYGRIALTISSFDLYWIAVDKSLHGRKIGKALLDRTEELISKEGGGQVFIETSNRHHYAPTRGFYLRCGYVQAALLKDFYAPDDDKVIYAKRVPGEG